LLPTAAERDKKSTFPYKEVKEIGVFGFFGILTSKEWGGCHSSSYN